MADSITQEDKPVSKMPWEQEWIEKPKQAIMNVVETVKEAVGSVKMPWERTWEEKSRATPQAAPKAATVPSTGFNMDRYTSKLISAESSGDPNAKAKKSSALGLAQFTNATWMEQVNKLGLNYTLKDRTDPAKVLKVLVPFTEENINKARKQLGREPTETEVYLYHFVPAKAAGLIQANPTALSTHYVSESTIKANKDIFYNKSKNRYTTPRTVGEVLSIFRKKMKEE